MSTHYSNPDRETEETALPDVEVYQVQANRAKRPLFDYACECGYTVCLLCGKPWYQMEEDQACPDCDGQLAVAGWYYWFCFPGCLPDSDAVGPFSTEAEALADAQSNNE